MDPTLAVLAGGLASAAFTNGIGPGFVLGMEARWNKVDPSPLFTYQIAAEVRTLLPTRAGTRPGDRPLDVSTFDVAVVPCAQYWIARVCVPLHGGVAMATGPREYAPPRDPVLAMGGFGPRVALVVPLGEGVSLHGFYELRFSVRDYDAGYYDGGRLVWRNPVNFSLFGLALSNTLP